MNIDANTQFSAIVTAFSNNSDDAILYSKDGETLVVNGNAKEPIQNSATFDNIQTKRRTTIDLIQQIFERDVLPNGDPTLINGLFEPIRTKGFITPKDLEHLSDPMLAYDDLELQIQTDARRQRQLELETDSDDDIEELYR